MPLEHLWVNRQIVVPAGSAAALITQGIAAHTWHGGNVVAFDSSYLGDLRGTQVKVVLGEFKKEWIFCLLILWNGEWSLGNWDV